MSNLTPIAIHCNILQHTATHCNTLQHFLAQVPSLIQAITTILKRPRSRHERGNTRKGEGESEGGGEGEGGGGDFYYVAPRDRDGQDIFIHDLKEAGFSCSQNSGCSEFDVGLFSCVHVYKYTFTHMKRALCINIQRAHTCMGLLVYLHRDVFMCVGFFSCV